MTKHIAVICNNEAEWKHFCNNMEWNLSKQNLPYRWGGHYLLDLSSNTKFIHMPNNLYKLNEKLYMKGDDFTIDLIIPMCKMECDVDEFLSNWRGRNEME